MRFLRQFSLALFLLGIIGMGLRSPELAQAATRTAVTNGNWNNAATWGGVIPANTDIVVIPAGITVTIPSSASVHRQGNTSVNGILTNSGQLINYAPYILDINGTFNNYVPDGLVKNYGTFRNDGTWFNGDWFTNESTGYLTNSGTMTNATGGTLDNYYSFYTSNLLINNGYLRNWSWIVNTVEGTVNNNNAILNYCIGVYNGTVTGTPVTEVSPASFPNLSTPLHRAHTTDTTPTFNWSSVANAESYRIMVYLEDHSFEYKKRVFDPNHTLGAADALTHSTKYLWRVRTQDLYCSTWSGWSGRYTLFVD